jgi:hypothetical protein
MLLKVLQSPVEVLGPGECGPVLRLDEPLEGREQGPEVVKLLDRIALSSRRGGIRNR